MVKTPRDGKMIIRYIITLAARFLRKVSAREWESAVRGMRRSGKGRPLPFKNLKKEQNTCQMRPRKFVSAFPFVWIIRWRKPPLRTDNLLIGCVSEYTLFNVNKTFIVDPGRRRGDMYNCNMYSPQFATILLHCSDCVC